MSADRAADEPATGAVEEAVEETVLTSRRAWLHAPQGVAPGRMRLTVLRLEVRPHDVAVTPILLDLVLIAEARVVRRPRALVEVTAPGVLLRFRCFSPAAVAALITAAAAAASGSGSGSGSRSAEIST